MTDSAPPAIKRPRPSLGNTLDARIMVLDKSFDVSPETTDKLGAISRVICDAASQIKDLVTKRTATLGDLDDEYDVGRLIAALDCLSECKNAAFMSLLIPRAVAKVQDGE